MTRQRATREDRLNYYLAAVESSEDAGQCSYAVNRLIELNEREHLTEAEVNQHLYPAAKSLTQQRYRLAHALTMLEAIYTQLTPERQEEAQASLYDVIQRAVYDAEVSQALQLMGKWRDPKAVVTLESYLYVPEQDNAVLCGDQEGLASVACRSLAQIGSQDAFDALVRTFQRRTIIHQGTEKPIAKEVMQQMALAIAEFPEKGTTFLISQSRTGKNAATRKYALYGLQAAPWGDERADIILREVLGNVQEKTQTRTLAASVLGERRSLTSIPFLLNVYLNTPQPDGVRTACKYALETMMANSPHQSLPLDVIASGLEDRNTIAILGSLRDPFFGEGRSHLQAFKRVAGKAFFGTTMERPGHQVIGTVAEHCGAIADIVPNDSLHTAVCHMAEVARASEREATELLRPSSAEAAAVLSKGQLLHPASSGDTTPTEQLLRSVEDVTPQAASEVLPVVRRGFVDRLLHPRAGRVENQEQQIGQGR